jgi:hypothetical protein
MLLEVLLILLLAGAAVATLLSFFIWKEKPNSQSSRYTNFDSDNPQRDL